MKWFVQRLVPAACLVWMVAAPAWAQGGATSAIGGVVKDSAGGVIPGATVIVTSNATGTKFEGATNTSGAFNVPALSAGVYTVTVSLEGFKTVEITDVRLQPGIPTTVNATLELGASLKRSPSLAPVPSSSTRRPQPSRRR